MSQNTPPVTSQSKTSPLSFLKRKVVEVPAKHQLLVRVKRTTGDGPWYAFGMLGGNQAGDDMTGHTFCCHIDDAGNQTWSGFYPLGAIVGWDTITDERDQINGIGDIYKYVAGTLYDGDAGHAYDDEKTYKLTAEQYKNAQAFAAKWKSSNTRYSLAKQNCTTFVCKDAKAAGAKVPGGGFPYDNPNSFGKNLSES